MSEELNCLLPTALGIHILLQFLPVWLPGITASKDTAYRFLGRRFFFYSHLLGTGEVFGLDIQALLPPSKRKQRKFSLTPYITLNSPLLYCIEESSESSVFPCSLWLYKAYITRKVFNQANNQRSSQEQVSNQPDLAGHACACRKNRMGEKFYRHSIPQRM